MKSIIFLFILSVLNINHAHAVTLKEALNQAFLNNTELNAERESLKISKEELNISRSNYLPSLSVSGSRSTEKTDKLTNSDGSNASINDVEPESKSFKVEQTLIDFGRGADYKKNKIGIDIAEDIEITATSQPPWGSAQAKCSINSGLRPKQAENRNTQTISFQTALAF